MDVSLDTPSALLLSHTPAPAEKMLTTVLLYTVQLRCKVYMYIRCVLGSVFTRRQIHAYTEANIYTQ